MTLKSECAFSPGNSTELLGWRKHYTGLIICKVSHIRAYLFAISNMACKRCWALVSCACVCWQLHGELDELQRQVNQRQGHYGSSLSSCKLTLQAFTQFENSLQGIENKVKKFSSTADKMIKDQHFDSRRIRYEVSDVERKWTDFCNSIKLYRSALDDSTKFFEVMDEVSDNRGYSVSCSNKLTSFFACNMSFISFFNLVHRNKMF